MIVRPEEPRDRDPISVVHVAAFEGRSQEARLVQTLRERPESYGPSLVAEADGRVVGHVLFTRVRAEGVRERTLLCLAPIGVLPEYQGRGIGSALIRRGLELADLPVVVLGHANYYPRFGFEPARPHGIECPWDVEDKNWMVWVPPGQDPGSWTGVVRFPAAFDEAV